MRGVVFTGGRELEMMDFPDPTPGPDEVVVEMKASGMCGSDLHQYRRPKTSGGANATGLPANPNPVIAGHEPCGVVAAVGPGVSDKEAKVGARVMVHHYQGCTQCDHCRSGWQQLCQEVPVKVYGCNSHGGHAKYLHVPANTLVPLADELTFSAGAAISCGSGTAYGALRRMNISGNDTIAIFGQGPVGLAGTQFAKAMGARVIALDINPQRLARAKDFGADEVVDPGSNDPVAAIKDLTHGRYADLSLDTSSNPEARLNAILAPRSGARCALSARAATSRSMSARSAAPSNDADRVMDVLQHHPGRMRAFCIERKVDVDTLFTHRWKLDQAEEAYKQFDNQSDGKGVFLM